VRHFRHQVAAEKVEEGGQLIDVGEAQRDAGEDARDEEAAAVQRVVRVAAGGDGKPLWELQDQDQGEGGEGVGFAAVE
jgi:hypothetical protein